MVNGISGQNPNYSAFYRAAAGNAVVNQNDVKNMVNFLNGQPVTMPEPTVAEITVQTLPFAAAFGGIQGFQALRRNNFDVKQTINNIKAASPYTQRSEALKSGLDNIKREYGDVLKKNVTPNATRAPFGLSKLLDKVPGYTKLRSTGIGKAMGKSGAGWMMVFDAVGKTMADVVPTFQQLGFSAGMKQVAKSGTQVVAGGAGWLAGDAVGTAIGTAICPGIGTAIGGFLGKFLGGVVGSAVASKAAKAVTGKNELEKVQEQQMAAVTQQVENDPNTKLALAQQTLEAANQILAQDPNNQDALAAKASAEKVINELQASVQQPVDQQTVQQPAVQNGFMTTMSGVPVVPGFNGVDYDMNVYTAAMANASMPSAFNPIAAANQYMVNPFGAQTVAQQTAAQTTAQQTTQTAVK